MRRHPDAAWKLEEVRALLEGSGHDRGALAAAARAGERARRQLASSERSLAFDFLLLEAVALNQLGANAAALVRLRSAVRLRPHHVEARLEQAMALFELGRFEQAEPLLRDLQHRAPGEAWVHHHLGLLEERRGDTGTAAREFARARALEPSRFPGPLQLSDEGFEAAVREGVARLPPGVRQVLEAAELRVDEFPHRPLLKSSRPPLSPHILGVCQSRGRRSPRRGSMVVLFRRNLLHFSRSRSELVEQIGITLMHEVGHLLGLGEEALYARGLE